MLSGMQTTNNKPVINCCIWLVDSFECVKMHGHTNPKLDKIVRKMRGGGDIKNRDTTELRDVRVTIVAVKKNWVSQILSVCL